MIPKNDDNKAAQISVEELRSNEPRMHMKVWLAWFLVVTVLAFVPAFTDPEFGNEALLLRIVFPPFYGVFSAFFYYGGYVWIRRIMYRSMIKRVTADAIEKRTESLQNDLENDFFNNLVKINFKYIDKYYLQTQIQADKAFTMCAIAALIGFVVIIAGVVQMYVGQTNPAYVTTAAGVISEFIAAVFFYLYNKTILKMAEYHRKLVLTQNIGLALRITQDLPDEQRIGSQISLVDRLSTDINALLAANSGDA